MKNIFMPKNLKRALPNLILKFLQGSGKNIFSKKFETRPAKFDIKIYKAAAKWKRFFSVKILKLARQIRY